MYIYRGDSTLGPFCGFDADFANGLDSLQYDYYYEELLNTVNLGQYAGDMVQTEPIQVGLKTGDHVRNYGFTFSWQVSGKSQQKYNFSIISFRWLCGWV